MIQSFNNQFIKNLNILGIMKNVSQNTDINRVMLAKEMNLTTAAITKIITPMIEDGFLEEESYLSEVRGRKSRYLRLSSGRYAVITIRLTRKTVYAAIEDINGTILNINSYDESIERVTSDDIFSYIRQMVMNLPSTMTCLGIVVVSPGTRQDIDSIQEHVNSCNGPYHWDFHVLKEKVENEFSLPFMSENDSNVALLGELWFGAGRTSDSGPVVLYNIGRGIGAAAFIDGRLLYGYNGSAVEIGHTTVDMHGPKCECGNYGCLELYAGTNRWKDEVANTPELKEHIGRFESCFGMARENDPVAIELVERYSKTVSVGLQTLASMFAPSMIIVVSNEADFIDMPAVISVMEKDLSTRMYSLSRDRIRIVAGQLGNMGYLKGSIVTALASHFSSSED